MESWLFPAAEKDHRIPQTVHNRVQLCVQPTSGAAKRFIQALYLPFFPAIGTFMHFDARSVHTQILHILICGQCMKYPFQSSIIPPFDKSGIHQLPGAINLWQFPLLCATSHDPENPIQHCLVIFPGATSLSVPFWQKKLLYSLPSFFCQFISFHAYIFTYCATFIF